MDAAGVSLHVVGAAFAVSDTGVQLPYPRARDLLGSGPAERDEQQARLVQVLIVPVDDSDHVISCELTTEPVRGQRSARATA